MTSVHCGPYVKPKSGPPPMRSSASAGIWNTERKTCSELRCSMASTGCGPCSMPATSVPTRSRAIFFSSASLLKGCGAAGLASLGATPVGMPLPQIPASLSKGVIDGCVIPWEVVPSVKVEELTKFHTEFDPKGGALYTTSFVMAMNKAKYDSLPADVKKIIDANSGIETSAVLGRTQQGNDPIGRKTAEDRKNTIYTMTPEETKAFRQAADLVDDDWVKEMNGKGFNGKMLLDTAKTLIAKHTK